MVGDRRRHLGGGTAGLGTAAGQDWAYLAVLAGAALVYFFFPRHVREQELLARYHAEDRAVA